MISGGLLKIHPSELKLPFEVKKQSSCCMQLTNKTDHYVAFKVKTTSPKKYTVRPNMGVVLPRSAITIAVTMQAQKEAPPDLQCKDKFLIQSVAADDGAATKDITSEMFNKAPGKVVEEFKLRVVYIPANPPSPVPEESEEGASPHSSTLENEASSTIFDDVSRSLEDSSTEQPHQERVPMSKLLVSEFTEEKNYAIQQKQMLQQELEQLRRSLKCGGGFSALFVVIVALLGVLIGYLLKKT
ncbi:vesicle-associated protein 1-3-like [Canna indica]|uniref:Vesicle-associated protein 1-3-like n=1 Tax=Canna indica TaxID=4628 RepID=A0AAQ3QCC5_9LILI|nr:vesicle-associated protein 1-3-like [Canna indica]